MNTYEREFQQLKPHDEVQKSITTKEGFQFIITAGHGYLVVPKEDNNTSLAHIICAESGYDFEGELAYYLEEDCSAPSFLHAIA
jgi:hypothetical protein